MFYTINMHDLQLCNLLIIISAFGVYWEFWENIPSLIHRVRSACLKGKQGTNLIAQILRCRCNILEVESEHDLLIINWQYYIREDKKTINNF